MSSNWVSSNMNDYNIFHIFAFDIIQYYNPNAKIIYINESHIDKNNPCQQWRFFVMNKLYPDIKIHFVNDTTYTPGIKTYGGYDCWQFIKYPIDNHILNIVNKINSKSKGQYILLNQRGINNREIYDNESNLPLQDYLLKKKFKYPFKYCNFEQMTPIEQYEICSEAAIFITAHGAGCTNSIFTPIECPLIEINLRTHWYCDMVCDDHFFNKIGVNEKCNGKLNYKNYFHKADYHNLCYLIGKKYTEIIPIKYGGKFTSRNPISKQQIFIDGNNLTKIIDEFSILNYLNN